MCEICCTASDTIIVCVKCHKNACVECYKTFFLGGNRECLYCGHLWTTFDVYNRLPRKWIQKVLEPSKCDVLFQREKALIPHFMPLLSYFQEFREVTKLRSSILHLKDLHFKALYHILTENIVDPVKVVLHKEYSFMHCVGSKLNRNDCYCEQKALQVFQLDSISKEWIIERQQLQNEFLSLSPYSNTEYAYNKISQRNKKLFETMTFPESDEFLFTVYGYVRRDDHVAPTPVVSKEAKIPETVYLCQFDNALLIQSGENRRTCSACNKNFCGTCEELAHHDHVCNVNVIRSLHFIAETTVGCPACKIRVSRVSGCSQMWCTECHTFFDYMSGKIYTGKFQHNPHYFEWKRTQVQAEVAIAPRSELLTDVQRFVAFFGEHLDRLNNDKNFDYVSCIARFQLTMFYLTGNCSLDEWKCRLKNFYIEREIKSMIVDMFITLVSNLNGLITQVQGSTISGVTFDEEAKILSKMAKEELKNIYDVTRFKFSKIPSSIYNLPHTEIFFLNKLKFSFMTEREFYSKWSFVGVFY